MVLKEEAMLLLSLLQTGQTPLIRHSEDSEDSTDKLISVSQTKSVDLKFLEFILKTWSSPKTSIFRQSQRIPMVLSEQMLLPSVQNLHSNVSEKRWTLLTLKLKRLILKFWKLCLSPNNISSSLWVPSIHHRWDKHTSKCQMSNGRTLVVLNKPKSNSKKWFCSQSNIQKSSWSLVCNHQRVSFSTVHQDVVRLFWLKQLPVNAVPILSQLKVLNFWQCGSVKVKPTLEMFLIRHELLLHVSSFSTSWIQLQLQEDHLKAMLEEPEIELSISFWQKWTVLEQKRTSSLLEPPTDPKFLMRPLLGQEDWINLSTFHYQINLQDLEF